MLINELFGTLQQAVVGVWREHLKTMKYSAHMALDELYKELPELVDSLIETWQGTHGLVSNYKCVIDETVPVTYLKQLINAIDGSYDCLEGDRACESILDEISALLKQILYKLQYLRENAENPEAADYMSLSDFMTSELEESSYED